MDDYLNGMHSSLCQRAFSQTLSFFAGAAALVDGNAAEPDPKKKKKRSYANAYTRKGEGLAAAIKSMKTAAVESQG